MRKDRDYLKDFSELNITEEEAEHILRITPAMYYPDVRPLYAQISNTYVFKKRICNNVAYIKLHINNHEVLVECLSFHKDYDRGKSMKCNVCGSEDIIIKDYPHKNYKIKDKEITYTAKRRICNKCDTLIYDKLLDNNSMNKAIKIYNESYGIPKEKIINLRKKYKLTQLEFSKIIGCAKKTLVMSWESQFLMIYI